MSSYDIEAGPLSRLSADDLEYVNRFAYTNALNRNSRSGYSENPFNHHDDFPLLDHEQRPKPILRRSLVAVVSGVVMIWLVALLTYSRVPNTGIDSYRDYNTSVAFGLTKNISSSAIVSSDSNSVASSASGTPLTLDEYRSGTFFVFDQKFNFITPPSDQKSSVDEGLYISPRSATGFFAKKVLDPSFSKHLLSPLFSYNGTVHSVESADPSHDLRYVLVLTNRETQWRHLSFSDMYILDVEHTSFTPLYEVNGTVARVSYACWSPNYNYISFVYENNVFIREVASGKVTQVTYDGGKDIFNGKPDWVYEEEVVALDRFLYWLPNEQNVVFIKTNDTNVPVYEIDYYTTNTKSKYPTHRDIKYPKPGYANPELTVINYNIADQSSNVLSHSDKHGQELGKEFVVYDVFWLNDNDFIVKESDRESKVLHYRFYDHNLGSSSVFKTVNAADEFGGWIDKSRVVVVPKNPSVGRNSDGYIDLAIDKNGFAHVAYFESKGWTPKKVFTHGDFDDKADYMAFDYERNVLYFTSTKQSSMSSHLYSVQLDLEKDVDVTALTDDTQLAYYEPSFSPSAKYLSLGYKGPRLPTQQLINLHGDNEPFFTNVKLLINTSGVEAAHKRVAVPTKQYLEIEVDPKTHLKVNVIESRPANFDPLKKYPLLVNFYGGPGSQRTQATYNVGFGEVVASSLDAIVLLVDPRGTDSKGWNFRKWSRNKMGYWEPRDIIAATKKYMLDNDFVDAEKVAAWGWSYSGFVTLKLLEVDSENVFKYGAAVAPVTDWRLYDSIYTERYIGTPENDPEGYKYATVGASDNFEFLNFKKKSRFLIMHGTGDDNVHIQNTFMLLDKLNLAEVENFDMKIFPDSDHSIYHHNANTIVYDKLFYWFKDAFTGNLDKLSG